ncbi:hypothetical protein ACTD5D_21380 [Nocardia takedensis]|uniref:hypothetical protein n=1 Tax=Nocardia takedensis TaxID=259390 RepID=UPI003F7730CC
MRALLCAAGAAIGVTLACQATAAAVVPDPAQPPNGIGVARETLVTPAWSPIQLPEPSVVSDADTTVVIAHPYLSGYVHDLVVLPADTAFEVRGAAELRLPGLDANGGALVLDPHGHCLFTGPGATPAQATALSPVHVDTPNFELTIVPALHH